MKNEAVPNKVLFVKTAASPSRLFLLACGPLVSQSHNQQRRPECNQQQQQQPTRSGLQKNRVTFSLGTVPIRYIEVVSSLSKVNRSKENEK
jgi:hypothetical protein